MPRRSTKNGTSEFKAVFSRVEIYGWHRKKMIATNLPGQRK